MYISISSYILCIPLPVYLFIHVLYYIHTMYIYIYTYVKCMLQYYIYCMYVYIDTLHMYVLPVYSTLVNVYIIYIYIHVYVIFNTMCRFAGVFCCSCHKPWHIFSLSSRLLHVSAHFSFRLGTAFRLRLGTPSIES